MNCLFAPSWSWILFVCAWVANADMLACDTALQQRVSLQSPEGDVFCLLQQHVQSHMAARGPEAPEDATQRRAESLLQHSVLSDLSDLSSAQRRVSLEVVETLSRASQDMHRFVSRQDASGKHASAATPHDAGGPMVKSEAAVAGVWPSGKKREGLLDDWHSTDTMCIVMTMVAFICFDLFVSPHLQYNLSTHAKVFAFMILASVVYGAFVWRQRGKTDGMAWATGYALEMALSTDNLFVFHMVFKNFSVPNDKAMFALTIGIYGAIVFRVIFILLMSQLFKLNYCVDMIVGLVLILSGFYALNDEEEEDVQNLPIVRGFKWMFGSRLQDKYSIGNNLFATGPDGSIQMTVLFLVVCVISVVDVVFAVDSVGSKTGEIKSVYINLSSCLMAMLSLRALFFIVKDAADCFDYVKYGICAILCFVGAEMIFSKWVTIPLGVMCSIIAVLFLSSVIASIAKVKLMEHEFEEEKQAPVGVDQTDGGTSEDSSKEDGHRWKAQDTSET